MEDHAGNRIVEKKEPITFDSIENSLNNRESYNEWVVKDFKVLGIFAAKPFEVSVLKDIEYPVEVPDYLKSDTPDPIIETVKFEVLIQTFHNSPIYMFDNSQIVRYEMGQKKTICHAEIYSQ